MWFKIAFALAFLAAAAIASSTVRRAAKRHGAPINQLGNEVRALVFVRAALGIVFYMALGTWLFRSNAAPWSYLPIPVALRWFAVALLVPNLIFFASSFRALGENYRGGVGLYDDHTLVVTGPYRLIRHPIYAGFIAIMILVTVISANWVLGASGLLLVGSIAAIRIPIEERELHERFGSTWEQYRDRAGHLFPRMSR